MKKQLKIVINAPIEKAFDTVDSDSKIAKWMGGNLKTEFKNLKYSENPVGTKFKHIMPGGIVVEGELIAYNKPFQLGAGQRFGILRGTVFYNFKFLEDKKTEMTCDLEIFEGSAAQKVLAKTMFPIFNRILEKHLKGLKELAENE